VNLNQVTLLAIDVAASVAFYRTMGFEPIVDEPHYARFKSTQGDATFPGNVICLYHAGVNRLNPPWRVRS
jgi:catechol 2,3-dioxygenase-like lactoylglutathione lyase family enzyme